MRDLPNKGEFIAILGPSGCGKSTILRLIAGLRPHHPPTEGTVLVFGKPVEQPGSDRSMVFQDYTSFDHRTVETTWRSGWNAGASPARSAERARRMDREGRPLCRSATRGNIRSELSGGMRQRVAIARTLILSPRIILMDEPFGRSIRRRACTCRQLLVDLWREAQATVFFVTHSIEEAVYLGDRVLRLLVRARHDPQGDGTCRRRTGRPRRCSASRSLSSAVSRSATSSTSSRLRRGRAMTELRCRERAVRDVVRRRRAGMGDYLQRGFLFRWNLLLFLGGAAAAALTPLAPGPAAARRRRRADVSRGAGFDARDSAPRSTPRCTRDAMLHRRRWPARAGGPLVHDARRSADRCTDGASSGCMRAAWRCAALPPAFAAPPDIRRRRPRKCARPASIGCSGCSCGCSSRRPPSTAFCRR